MHAFDYFSDISYSSPLVKTLGIKLHWIYINTAQILLALTEKF